MSSPHLIVSDRFKDALLRITPYVEKYKNEKNIELEFRLGFMDTESNAPQFQTDIPLDFFNKIEKKLHSNKNWDSVENVKTTDYFNSNYRISVDDTAKKIQCIKKTKLVTLDFQFEDTPFDIRFCISREEPCSVDSRLTQDLIKKSNHSRQKTRSRFKHKYCNFDITQVKEIENTVEDITHEIELDIDCTYSSLPTSEHIVYSTLLKINDLVNMCESASEQSKITFVRSSFGSKKTLA